MQATNASLVNMNDISDRLQSIRQRMTRAAENARRDPSLVRLIAVSKTFPAEAVRTAAAAGQTLFGENRVEEAVPKLQDVAASHNGLHWHLIGHLQSKKSKDAGRHFALIHSVDSVKLATKIAAVSPAPQPILLQCNVSGEDSKEGFDLSGWREQPQLFEQFATQVAEIMALPAIRICGLMTLAPIVPSPDLARPTFASLRELRDALRARFEGHTQASWEELSMGMSDDFEAAIAEGATLIRIGRAIFGTR
jgi:PLP dependent protein